MPSSARFQFWFAVFVIAGAVLVCSSIVNAPSIALFHSQRESEERVIRNLHRELERLKQDVGNKPFEEWDPHGQLLYRNGCKILREHGEPLPDFGPQDQ
jgi:hypothetical protein